MKKSILLVVFAFMAFGLQAQEKKAAITFESDVIDYGDIAHGGDGTREFKFKNTGDAVLVVSKVYSTCGCTIPKKPENPIQPGESGVIEVKYNTSLAAGPIRKTITVYTNASEEPYTLKIKGNLLPEQGAMEKARSGASK